MYQGQGNLVRACPVYHLCVPVVLHISNIPSIGSFHAHLYIYKFIVYIKNVDIKFSVHNEFLDNLHQISSKSKGLKAKYFFQFWEQVNKDNNKITELRTIFQRESQNS